MADDQSNERPSQPAPQAPAEAGETTTPPAEKPRQPRGFWQNPTEPLERSYDPQPSKREGE